jgi:hypothetical protein
MIMAWLTSFVVIIAMLGESPLDMFLTVLISICIVGVAVVLVWDIIDTEKAHRENEEAERLLRDQVYLVEDLFREIEKEIEMDSDKISRN